MKDAEIRSNFHKKRLKRHHEDPDTLVIDELGLRHGACRADIAVVNGHLLGYEIKSDADVLSRLPAQVSAYNAVFDRITVISGERHICEVSRILPTWWGIMLCHRGARGGVHFITERASSPNPQVDPMSVAKLLWRPEAVSILEKNGEPARTLRATRQVLYSRLVEILSIEELKDIVRLSLRMRANWRCQAQASQCGG